LYLFTIRFDSSTIHIYSTGDRRGPSDTLLRRRMIFEQPLFLWITVCTISNTQPKDAGMGNINCLEVRRIFYEMLNSYH